MTTSSPASPTVPARGLRAVVASLAFWLGVLVLGAGLIGMSRPLESYIERHDQRFPADPTAIVHQEGFCYLLPFAQPQIPSSSTGTPSRLILLEDGAPLERDDIHQRIRQEGAGRFSHWGDNIWFASSDGSDPRSNGRSYTLVLPENTESPWKARLPWLPPVGAGLMLLGLLLAFRLPRLLLAGTLAACAWLWAGLPTDLLMLDRAIGSASQHLAQTSSGGDSTPVAHAASSGNVTRLDLAEFSPEPAAERQVARPFNLEIVLPDCAETHDGQVRLSGRDCAIRGNLDGDLPALRLAELVITARFLEGERFEVRALDRNGDELASAFDVPVIPSPDEQTVRIRRPLGMYALGELPRVGAIEVRAPASGEPLRCAITGMALIDEWQVYGSQPSGTEIFQLGKSLRPASWQSLPGEFRVALPERPGLLLKGSVAVKQPQAGRAANIEVLAEAADGSRRRLLAESLSGSQGWRSLRHELSPDDAVVALVFRCADQPADAVVAWAGWRLVDTSRAPQRVFVTLMDTLRADALSCYASGGATTPRLDALAAEGALFENCYSQCYWTRPSMASLMSSRYVQATGVHSSSHRLPEAYVTVPEVFAQGGFYTVGTVSNSNAASAAGLQFGWDEFNEHLIDDATSLAGDYCSTLVEPRLLDLLEEDLLVYVHLMDAHAPYGPVEQPSDWTAPPGEPLVADPRLDRPWLTEPTREARVQLYHEDVRALDAGWGAFLDRMLARWEVGDAPATVVAVLSDHGEFLGEHGQWSHKYYKLLPEVTRVPLLLRAPGRIEPGLRVSTPVENLDVGPTLLALVGLGDVRTADWDGRDLRPLLSGDPDAPGQALTSSGADTSLFSVYANSGAVIGMGERVDRLLRPIEGSSSSDGPDAVRPTSTLWEDWARRRVEAGFRLTRERYAQHGDAVRDLFWGELDASATLLDAEALQQLAEMGYLAR